MVKGGVTEKGYKQNIIKKILTQTDIGKLKDLIHETLEGWRSLSEAKDNQKLVMPLMSLKCCLMHILLEHSNLVVSWTELSFEKTIEPWSSLSNSSMRGIEKLSFKVMFKALQPIHILHLLSFFFTKIIGETKEPILCHISPSWNISLMIFLMISF